MPTAPSPQPAAPPSLARRTVPDIHGGPASEVQALQNLAAETLGRPVVFRDPPFSSRLVEQVETGRRKWWFGTDKVIYEDREVIRTIAPPEMIIIPAGRFLMGSPDTEAGRSNNEGPQHQVTISRHFAPGRHAVSFDDYDTFCSATGPETPGDQG